jgi:ParB family chromosome partitioning protein
MAETRQMSLADKLTQRVARAEEARANAGTDALDAFAVVGTKDKVLENILPGQHLAPIRVELISPAPEGQARKDFDEVRLQALAESLKRSGVREPIIVTPHGAAPGRFQLVAGERRWRAAQLAGLAEIPCIVDPKLVERHDKLLAQAEENLHRENLNPVEEARVLVQIMEARKLDVREAGELMGRSYAQSRRLHRIAMAIEPIKQAILRGELDARAAIEVDRVYNAFAQKDMTVGLAEAGRKTEQLIERIVREGWSIRRLEQYAKKTAGSESQAEDASNAAKQGESRGVACPGDQEAAAAPSPVHDLHPAPSATPPLFTRTEGRISIEEHRIVRGSVSPEELEQLIAILEDLLVRVRRT